MKDVIVVGAGPAGVIAALPAADLGARTALVTRGEFGGMALGRSEGRQATVRRLLLVLGTAAVALPAAVLVERRVPAPLIDLALLRDRVFASALVSLIVAIWWLAPLDQKAHQGRGTAS